MRFNPKAYVTAVSAIAASLACATAAHADTPIAEGISVFGTVDVGYAYQSAGVPLNGVSAGGLEWQSFTTTRNFNGSQSTIAENGLEQSKIGVAVSEKLGNSGFVAVGRIETAFNPLSGELTDACKSLVQESGVGTPANPAGQTANYDSSRCGQAINGVAYAGVSSKEYGTLTFGRQASLLLSGIAAYDPQASSPAFSLFGYSGIAAGGGSTEAARLDNSVAYTYSADMFHISGLYSKGGADTGVLGSSYMASAGVAASGFNIDVAYAKFHGAVNLRSSFDNAAAPTSGSPPAGLAAFISTNTSVAVLAKYTMAMADKSKLAIMAGYTHFEKAHNGDTVGASQSDYPISIGININNTAKYDAFWFGARYTTAANMTVAAGFYHVSQNSWTIGLGPNGTQNLDCSAAGLLCSGAFNEASLSITKPVVKHVDVYAGINYSKVSNGLAWGFASDQAGGGSGTTGSQSQTTLATGVRVKF